MLSLSVPVGVSLNHAPFPQGIRIRSIAPQDFSVILYFLLLHFTF